MTTRFRIKPVAPDRYVVQRKGLVFWRTEKRYCYEVIITRSFRTKDEAKDYIDTQIARAFREAERAVATKLHLQQPIEEYPA